MHSLFFFLSVAMSTCLLRKKRRRWREKPYAIETATLAKSQKVSRNLSWLTRLDFLIPSIDAKRKILYCAIENESLAQNNLSSYSATSIYFVLCNQKGGLGLYGICWLHHLFQRITHVTKRLPIFPCS